MIKLFEYIIVNMSWWDTFDYVAVHSKSEYVKMHPEVLRPVMVIWMDSEFMAPASMYPVTNKIQGRYRYGTFIFIYLQIKAFE